MKYSIMHYQDTIEIMFISGCTIHMQYYKIWIINASALWTNFGNGPLWFKLNFYNGIFYCLLIASRVEKTIHGKFHHTLRLNHWTQVFLLVYFQTIMSWYNIITTKHSHCSLKWYILCICQWQYKTFFVVHFQKL